MTADRDHDRQLVGWLYRRATGGVPDGLLARSLERVDGTRQRPGWLVRDRGRSPQAMGRPATASIRESRSFAMKAVVVAVIGALAVGGISYLSRPGRPAVGGSNSTPVVTPSPSPSEPARTPTPRPTPAGPITPARQVHTATLLADGRVLVAGGYDANDVALASAELYDPATNTFTSTGSLVTARGLHTATLLADGRVLIAGGGPANWLSTAPGPYLASAELYDPKTGSFSPTGLMTSTREDHTATLLDDGRVLIAGGNDVGAHAVASAELYDPKTGKFSATGSMTTPRGFHTATLLADGRVLITGGDLAAWSDSGPFLASAEIYDPKTGKFTATASMTIGRAWHGATLLADGRVLITGGTEADSTSLASAETYDPKTGKFTATGSMTIGRIFHSATLLSDGRVLVAGGCANGPAYSVGNFLASTEIYDPKTGKFTATGSMTDARTFQQATLLADGRVLITAGEGDNQIVAPLASAEIYDPNSGTFSPTGQGG
jgi:hypothetical protein